MVEKDVIKKPRTTGYDTRITLFGVTVAEHLRYSPDIEFRSNILKKLKESYDRNPKKYIQNSHLEAELQLSKEEVLRNLLILEYFGQIRLRLYSGGHSEAKIKAEGIDSLKRPIEIDYESELMKESYSKLYILENGLRRYLEKTLYEEYGEDWWKKGVSHRVRSEVETLKAQCGGTEPIINYSLFPHLRLIIIKDGNWKKIYEPIFESQNTYIARLEELEPIRNKIAHSRMLSDEEITKLELFYKEIMEKIS